MTTEQDVKARVEHLRGYAKILRELAALYRSFISALRTAVDQRPPDKPLHTFSMEFGVHGNAVKRCLDFETAGTSGEFIKNLGRMAARQSDARKIEELAAKLPNERWAALILRTDPVIETVVEINIAYVESNASMKVFSNAFGPQSDLVMNVLNFNATATRTLENHEVMEVIQHALLDDTYEERLRVAVETERTRLEKRGQEVKALFDRLRPNYESFNETAEALGLHATTVRNAFRGEAKDETYDLMLTAAHTLLGEELEPSQDTSQIPGILLKLKEASKENPETYSSSAVGEKMGVSDRTIRRWWSEGAIPAEYLEKLEQRFPEFSDRGPPDYRRVLQLLRVKSKEHPETYSSSAIGEVLGVDGRTVRGWWNGENMLSHRQEQIMEHYGYLLGSPEAPPNESPQPQAPSPSAHPEEICSDDQTSIVQDYLGALRQSVTVLESLLTGMRRPLQPAEANDLIKLVMKMLRLPGMTAQQIREALHGMPIDSTFAALTGELLKGTSQTGRS
jgi:hypothetical protein